MTFFNKVIANESKNRMSIWNISTIMAPNLFFSRSKHSDCEELLLANTAAHIIRLMLKYQEMLWTVSTNVTTWMFLLRPPAPTQETQRLVSKQCPQSQGEIGDLIPSSWRHLSHSTELLAPKLIFH